MEKEGEMKSKVVCEINKEKRGASAKKIYWCNLKYMFKELWTKKEN